MLIPARIKSTSGFSNDVINITVGSANSFNTNRFGNNFVPSFNSSEIHVDIKRNQPPLIKITVPEQTPLGIYTVPLIATIKEPSMATTTKPTFIAPLGGALDPKFSLSKKYPTVGYLTQPVNLTVTITPPMDIEDQFKEFWATYGQFISIFAGAFVGAFAREMFGIVKRKKRKKEKMICSSVFFYFRRLKCKRIEILV